MTLNENWRKIIIISKEDYSEIIEADKLCLADEFNDYCHKIRAGCFVVSASEISSLNQHLIEPITFGRINNTTTGAIINSATLASTEGDPINWFIKELKNSGTAREIVHLIKDSKIVERKSHTECSCIDFNTLFKEMLGKDTINYKTYKSVKEKLKQSTP